MSESCNTPETEADPREADPREVRAERRLFMLGLLAEIGMQLAKDLSRRVGEGMERGEPLDGGAVALEFSRISRAVRQTVALEARLDQDCEALAKMFAAERAAREQALVEARESRIESRRDAVREAALGAIDRIGGGQRKLARLYEALDERLEDPREDDDFADLPVSALVGRICAALGVPVDWDLWKNSDWAAEEWRAAVADSPYAPMTPSPMTPSPMTGEGGLEPLTPCGSAPVSGPPRRWSG